MDAGSRRLRDLEHCGTEKGPQVTLGILAKDVAIEKGV